MDPLKEAKTKPAKNPPKKPSKNPPKKPSKNPPKEDVDALEEAKTHANQDPHTADTTKKLTDVTNHPKLDVNIASSEVRLTDAVEEAPNLKTLLM